MSGSALLVGAALAAAALVSMLLWLARRLFRRRPKSFREQLAAVSDRPAPVGPAGGVSVLDEVTEMRSRSSNDEPDRPPVVAAGSTLSSNPANPAAAGSDRQPMPEDPSTTAGARSSTSKAG